MAKRRALDFDDEVEFTKPIRKGPRKPRRNLMHEYLTHGEDYDYEEFEEMGG